MKKENESMLGIGDQVDKLYGLEADESLQSVNFATTENEYLNEHFQEKNNDEIK